MFEAQPISKLRKPTPLIRNAVLLFLLLAGLPVLTIARELKFHGPLLQWTRDPTTSVTLTWVERISPGITTAPVWKKGPSGFGYGDGDDRTEIPEMEDEFERIYIARKFELDSLPPGEPLRLLIRYDDAFVAWINGTEIARSPNLKRHHAQASVRGAHEAEEVEEFVIENPAVFLNEGENLVAIEGHNVRKSSSDLTLDPVLKLGDRTLVDSGDEWSYLAGDEPEVRWFLREPRSYPGPELPKEEKSEWTLGVRLRGSDAPYASVAIDERKFGPTGNPLFEARIEGLEPDTAYEYFLAASKVPVKTGWFRTAPARLTRPFSFVVGGDMGTSTAVPVCRLAGAEDPLFALIGGDLAYANGTLAFHWYDWLDNWSEFVVGPGGRDIPIIAGIGNHERKGYRVRKSAAPFYFSLFDLPLGDSNFTVDFGDYLSVIVLDTNYAQEVEDQTWWLKRQLEQRKKVPHQFVIYHRPAWGTGVKRNSSDVQEEWCPLFEEYRVDCVFENDHHTYKRTHKIRGGFPDEERGVLYIGDGAWGASLRTITDDHLERVGARDYLAKWASRHHLVKVTLSPDGTRLYQAKAPGGEVFDEYRDREPLPLPVPETPTPAPAKPRGGNPAKTF